MSHLFSISKLFIYILRNIIYIHKLTQILFTLAFKCFYIGFINEIYISNNSVLADLVGSGEYSSLFSPYWLMITDNWLNCNEGIYLPPLIQQRPEKLAEWEDRTTIIDIQLYFCWALPMSGKYD